MKYITIIFVFFAIGCTSENQLSSESNRLDEFQKSSTQIKYDFVSDSIGFNTPQEVAIQVIEFLQKRDTTKYLETTIPLDAQKYLFAQNFEYRPDIKDQEAFMNWLESRFQRRMNNFIIRAGYITEIMERDKKFQISDASIDTITFENIRIKSYGGFDRFIVGEWADVTVKMNYNDEEYFFEVPQIIKLKDKWFLYYPEYYIRTKRDLEFIEKRVKEMNQKADEFWL